MRRAFTTIVLAITTLIATSFVAGCSTDHPIAHTNQSPRSSSPSAGPYDSEVERLSQEYLRRACSSFNEYDGVDTNTPHMKTAYSDLDVVYSDDGSYIFTLTTKLDFYVPIVLTRNLRTVKLDSDANQYFGRAKGPITICLAHLADKPYLDKLTRQIVELHPQGTIPPDINTAG